MSEEKKGVEEQCRDFRRMFESLRREIGKVIVGYDEIVGSVLTSLFCGGRKGTKRKATRWRLARQIRRRRQSRQKSRRLIPGR